MPNVSSRRVCRLLGGTGRAPRVAVPAVKLPALLAPVASCVGSDLRRMPHPTDDPLPVRQNRATRRQERCLSLA
jgi:hypothetical protein